MAHVSSFKKQEVKTLKKLIDSHPVVGLVDVEGIKARQMQRIRKDLRGKAVIRGSKNTLLAVALKKSKRKLNALADYMEGGASLICTDIDPFQLNMLLEKSRTPAPAKPGDTAPDDIVIAAGDTGFPPGPLVGELQRAGVPARIERGAIVVQKEHTFVKAGETISEQQAVILRKLGMEPMTAGLSLLGVCENGSLYEPSVLHVDREGVVAQVGQAYHNALNLCIEACIVTEDTITLLIQKAVRHSNSLALKACIITPETIPQLLAKAYANARTIESLYRGEPAVPSEPVLKAPPETEEEEKEEEALEGLGALFG
jgi:large subunit ribosomal protein L10